jgi:hypothetical protein
LWQLSETDRRKYACLKASLMSTGDGSERNRRVAAFTEMLDAIKNFALQGDKHDSLRCIVCGICWLSEGLAVNTHELRQLIPKCKSSINGSLQRLGYTINLNRTESSQAMAAFCPYLKDNTAELRKWTVRRRLDSWRPPETIQYRPPVVFPVAEQKFEISLEGLSRPKSAPIHFSDDIGGFELDSSLTSWNDFVQEPRWTLSTASEHRQTSFAPIQDDICLTFT